jgi:serine/threonine-protein kinase
MATCPRCFNHYADDVTTCADDGEALIADDAFSAPEPDVAEGTKVGEYRVDGKLGEGGFGAVYRAEHPVIGKAAAIKVLNRQFSANPEIVSRFVAEARAVNQIRHRNIIDIFAFGQLPDGRHYYVMELLRGATLDRYLAERGRLTVAEAAPLIRGIARALAAAHAAGIAHRDLKPENVFIADGEDGPYPKLIDFGIAKLLGEGAPTSHKTRTGAPIGTPYYMSPEQCRGRGVDQRTDIYALGVLIHVLLTGALPFDGGDMIDVFMKHISEAPPRMSEVCADVPAALDEPVLRMLAKHADERPQTATAALEAFEAAMDPAARTGSRPSVPGPALRVAVTPAGPPPGDLRELADARTVMPDGISLGPGAAEPMSTLEPSARPLAPRAEPVDARRQRLLVPAVGALALLSLGIGVLAGRGPAPATTVAPTATVARTATLAPPTPAPVAPGPTVVPADAAEVELRIESTPEIVDVLLDEQWLGTSRDPIRVKHADTVKLTFRAPGHVTALVDVPATASHVVRVHLVSSGSPPPPRPTAATPASKPEKPAKPPPRKGGNADEIAF